MTTDIEVRGAGREVATFAPTAPEAIHAALEQWVGGMAASVHGAEYIVDTPMCPDSFWPLPAGTKSKAPKQLLAGEDLDQWRERRRIASYTLGSVVRYGLQLGLPPEVAVQGIFTVGGRMSMYAEQMVALIKSQGHGHRVVERTRERCTVEVCRRGTDEWRPYTFTFDDAVQAGYVPRQGPNPANPGTWPDGKPKPGGGNEKYLTDPATMLYARASSIACRTEFPDVLRGLTSYEDMQDEQSRVEVTVDDIAPARARAAEILARADRASAAIVTARAAEPVEDAQPAPAPEPQEAPTVERYVMPVSKPQLDLIKTAFEKHGFGGRAVAVRADRMRVLSELVGRQIEDPRDLTSDEGRLVIDNIGPDSAGHVIDEILGIERGPADERVVADEEELDASVELGFGGDR
jgi:hypothetical protein